MPRPPKDPTKPSNIKRVALADGSVRWRLKFYVGVDPETRKKEFIHETFDTEGAAKDKAATLRTARAGGAPIRASKQTLDAFLKAWLRDVKAGEVRPRTLCDYREVLNRYVFNPPKGMPRIGRTRLNKLHTELFEKLFAHMRNEMGLSQRTIQYLRGVLHNAMQRAVKMKQLAQNPVKDAAAPKYKLPDGTVQRDADYWRTWDTKRKPKAMTREQARAFLEAARGDRHYALWVTLMHSGMRPSEALGLFWDDVDLDTGQLHVHRALTRRGVKGWALMPCKTERSERTIPIGETVVAALRSWRSKQAQERLLLGAEYRSEPAFVFTTEFGSPLDTGNLCARHFRRICEAAHKENPDLGFGEWRDKMFRERPVLQKGEPVREFRPSFWVYCLRHTAASLLLEAGVDLKTVSGRLGHKTEVMTLTVYSHVMPSMEARATEVAERVFGQSG